MKIRDIKGIAEKLPKELHIPNDNYCVLTEEVYKKKELLSTDINLEDICEIDEIESKAIMRMYHELFYKYQEGKISIGLIIQELSKAIAKYHCFKWKE